MLRRRSPRTLLVPAALLLLACPSPGAPSTDLPGEFYTGLEQSVGQFALVDKASGQIRIGTVTAGNSASFTGPFRTFQPDVTAVTSGFLSGGTEQVALSSITSNRVIFAPVDSSPTTVFFPQYPGPDGVALVRQNGAAIDRILLDSVYGPSALHALELTEKANLGTPAFIVDAAPLAPITSLQPHYLAANSRREAVCVSNASVSPRFLHVSDLGLVIGGRFSDPLPLGTRLATNIRNLANRLTVVGFVPGSATLTLITIDTIPTPWVSITPFPTDTVPFPVGNVAAAVGLAGAPNGLLITSQDGTQAAYAQVNAAGTMVNIVQNFTNSPGLLINAMVPVPGRGILRLEGPGGPSTDFIYGAWDGAQFANKDTGPLPSLLPPQTDFATILWYDGEPSIDPNAKLLQLDIEPDWANGTGPLPSALTRETFATSAGGLENPLLLALTPPTGATYVITNQLLEACSLAVLRPNSALLDPPLTVVPPSGNYDNPVLVDADSIETDYDIFFREDRAGVPWQQYEYAFGVGYPSTWLFYAKDKLTSATGPILSRAYSFAPTYSTFDSDNDGVPDFVEQWAGLDPNGGADSDGDLQSDMEEILQGTDPNDITDFEADPLLRDPPFIGEGFLLIAEALDTTIGEASPGETIEVRNMSSAVLDDDAVQVLAAPPVLVGQLGAPIKVLTPVSFRHWAVLNSPLYFGLGNVPSPPHDGREVYRLLQIPDIPLPVINPVLVGNDLDTDAAAWIAAAQAAYAAFEPVTSITDIRPLDTAVAVLGEAALHAAFLPIDPGTLGFPTDQSFFTLFGQRAADSERTPLSEAMVLALEVSGLSFNNLLAILDAQVAAAANLQTLVTAIYDWHVVHSDPADVPNYMPGLPLPLDVLRGLIIGNDLPFEVAPDPPGPPNWDYRPAIAQPVVDAAKAELAAALALLPSAYRPVANWIIEIGPPTMPDQKYGYTNTGTLNPAVLLNQFGEFITLDQGLGLAHGTLISVQGYTDVTGPAGHDAIEAIAVAVQSVPLASDSDLNANLLDDKWEQFFFGAHGVVGPFDLHPVSGFTYLSYHLAGADPRDDSMDPPVINVLPPDTTIVVLPNTNFGLEFEFPDIYFDAFDWGVEQSTDLQGFVNLPAAVVTPLGENQYEVDLGVAASSLVRNFFRLTIALKSP